MKSILVPVLGPIAVTDCVDFTVAVGVGVGFTVVVADAVAVGFTVAFADAVAVAVASVLFV